MREILTDLFTWPWFSETHGCNFNGHLIRHPIELTAKRLTNEVRLPIAWEDQQALLETG